MSDDDSRRLDTPGTCSDARETGDKGRTTIAKSYVSRISCCGKYTNLFYKRHHKSRDSFKNPHPETQTSFGNRFRVYWGRTGTMPRTESLSNLGRATPATTTCPDDKKGPLPMTGKRKIDKRAPPALFRPGRPARREPATGSNRDTALPDSDPPPRPSASRKKRGRTTHETSSCR